MVLVLAGCNTMEGLGQDVQAAGGKLESSADRNKR
ncbi:MAG: entericidin A/B family lipoprotein [Lautropia sp.]